MLAWRVTPACSFPPSVDLGVAFSFSTKIYVHCKLGGRAAQAAALLAKMGYDNVIPLAASYDQIAEVMPTESGDFREHIGNYRELD